MVKLFSGTYRRVVRLKSADVSNEYFALFLSPESCDVKFLRNVS
jgi:hypothetical protein